MYSRALGTQKQCDFPSSSNLVKLLLTGISFMWLKFFDVEKICWVVPYSEVQWLYLEGSVILCHQ